MNGIRGARALVGTMALAAALCMSAGTASAGVPKGRYICFPPGGDNVFHLTIDSRTKYTWDNQPGKYDFKPDSSKLVFDGPLKKFVGKLTRPAGEAAEITLKSKRNPETSVGCGHTT